MNKQRGEVVTAVIIVLAIIVTLGQVTSTIINESKPHTISEPHDIHMYEEEHQ
jgi:hypothetical protein